jgi:subtilisin-like proprotein convertase family protein
VNACGAGAYTDPFSFRTVSQSCIDKASTTDQNNIAISGSGLPTITSVINVTQSGEISDVNVTRVRGSHSAVRDIQIRLKGPDNTSVILLSQPACNGSNFNCGFDDQSPQILTNCPMNNLKYKPVGSLADFVGKNAQGNWTLELEVVDSDGEGGTFNDWELQICAALQSASPVIVKNDTLEVPPGGTNRIYTENLVANDADNSWDELEFTIIKNTAFGQVKLNGQTLGVGGKFTMEDVFSSYLTYTNTSTTEPYDYFTFTVSDGEGGFAGTPRFHLKMDAGADIIGGADDQLAADELYVFPNPATDELNLLFEQASTKVSKVTLTDVQGRNIATEVEGLGSYQLKMRIGAVPSGIYFVKVQTERGSIVKKVVVE